MAWSLPRGLTHHYHITLLTEARNTFGSDSNCAKWTLSPAGDVTHARKNNKGCIYLSKANNLAPHPQASHPRRGLASLLLFFSACSHTQTKTHTTHEPKHKHALTRTRTDWNPRSTPLERGNYFTADWADDCVTWSEERVCLSAVLGFFFGGGVNDGLEGWQFFGLKKISAEDVVISE